MNLLKIAARQHRHRQTSKFKSDHATAVSGSGWYTKVAERKGDSWLYLGKNIEEAYESLHNMYFK